MKQRVIYYKSRTSGMVRRRAPHPYHEPEVHDPDSVCSKCGKSTVKVCKWCGVCVDCHKGMKNGTQNF